MPEDRPMKTFEVTCAACSQPFSLRKPLANPEAEDSAEVVVECLYCQESVKVTLPRKYAETQSIMRLKSVQVRT